jgi:hypothetical protein
MTRKAVLENVKSRWDARYLVTTVMGLILKQESPSANTVMAVVTVAVKAYTKGLYGRCSPLHDEGVFQDIKDYAWERVYLEGRDSELMKEFIDTIGWAEAEVWNIPVGEEKLFSAFPMNCLREGELTVFKNESWKRFHAKFYQPDGNSGNGMLVFADGKGCEAFVDYMMKNHRELKYENLENAG